MSGGLYVLTHAYKRRQSPYAAAPIRLATRNRHRETSCLPASRLEVARPRSIGTCPSGPRPDAKG